MVSPWCVLFFYGRLRSAGLLVAESSGSFPAQSLLGEECRFVFLSEQEICWDPPWSTTGRGCHFVFGCWLLHVWPV